MTALSAAAARRHMLLPKPARRQRRPFIPALPDCMLPEFLAELCPADRLLLRWIAVHADLIETPGAPPHLLVPMTSALVDQLAAVGAELEDREPDLADEEHEPAEASLGSLEVVDQEQWARGTQEDLEGPDADAEYNVVQAATFDGSGCRPVDERGRCPLDVAEADRARAAYRARGGEAARREREWRGDDPVREAQSRAYRLEARRGRQRRPRAGRPMAISPNAQ